MFIILFSFNFLIPLLPFFVASDRRCKKSMSFIRIGEHCFNKKKIVCIEVSRRPRGGHTLLLKYDHPYVILDVTIWKGYDMSPTMDFETNYSDNEFKQLKEDVALIMRGNMYCLFDDNSRFLSQFGRE